MIVVIVGPTGVGKTALSIALAKHYNTEVISGDSVQVYKEMDIGSAKVTKEEMDNVPHHMIDILAPTENFSVAIYQDMVRKKIEELTNKDKLPIIAGGTGLYIKSVLFDYNFEDTKRDFEFEKSMANIDNETLHKKLKEKDQESAEKIHPNNRKRVLQALQRSDTHKVSSEQSKDNPVYDFVMIGLRMPREELYERINQRVDRMLEQGLLTEVKALYEKGISTTASMAIGYKELFSYLSGETTFEEAVQQIKTKSRQFAKRQFTFFQNQFNVHWIDVDLTNFSDTVDDAITYIDKEVED